MKKIYIIIAFIASISSAYSQNSFRINDKDRNKIKQVSPDLLNNLLFIENRLDKNIGYLKDGKTDLIFKPNFKELATLVNAKELSKVEKYFCYECYKKEWESQQNELIKREKREQELNDSIYSSKLVIYNNSNSTHPEGKKERISNDKPLNDVDPYDKLRNSLRAFNYDNLNFTVFRNIDYNYAGTALSTYLQIEMGLSSKDFKITRTTVTEKFIPKASKRDDYLLLTYSVTEHNNIKGYTSSKPVYIINSLEITGTPKLVTELFLNYWKGKMNIEAYKQGVIASKEVLGDFITIESVSPSLFKIKVSKGNTDVNYYNTYGINAPDNN